MWKIAVSTTSRRTSCSSIGHRWRSRTAPTPEIPQRQRPADRNGAWRPGSQLHSQPGSRWHKRSRTPRPEQTVASREKESSCRRPWRAGLASVTPPYTVERACDAVKRVLRNLHRINDFAAHISAVSLSRRVHLDQLCMWGAPKIGGLVDLSQCRMCRAAAWLPLADDRF